MESVLNFVYAIGKTEIGHEGTFNHAYKLLLFIFLVLLVIGSDRNKGSQFSLVTEAFEWEANIDFIVECDYIQNFFEVFSNYFVIDKGFLWK